MTHDKSTWLATTHDSMNESIAAILRVAGFTHPYVVFSMFETTVDPRKDDLSDWGVRYPDMAANFARGKCQFLFGPTDDDGNHLLVKDLTDPTWGDVLIIAETCCRARGAPELDHIFLERVEPVGPRSKGVQRFEFSWGS